MWTWVIVAVVFVVLLALVVRLGNRQRRGNRPGDVGGKVSPKATGTTGAYYGDL